MKRVFTTGAVTILCATHAVCKINEKLGIEAEDGQSTEDAIKNEVKDKLLRKLFD